MFLFVYPKILLQTQAYTELILSTPLYFQKFFTFALSVNKTLKILICAHP